ncbi:MAG: VOC family protein [Chloroflexota bacterium]|nr:VOC family protein [Chloroflexota bacterium]
MLRGIHHTGITVTNLDRSLGFYRDLLGLKVRLTMVRDTPDIGEVVGYPGARIKIAFVGVPGDTVVVELLEYLEPHGAPRDPETRNPAAGHVCFDVEDIHAIYERLAGAGVHVRSNGPVELKQGVNKGAFALYCRDPDGYTVELRQPPTS